MNTVVFTTSSIVNPAALRISRTLFRHCSVRSATPPGAIEPSARSGVCPDTKTISPEEIPCEYGPIAPGAFAVTTGVRFTAYLKAASSFSLFLCERISSVSALIDSRSPNPAKCRRSL